MSVRQSVLTPPPHEGPAVPYEEQVEHARATLPAIVPQRPEHALVALDVDGTILTARGASANVRRAITNALEAGINVVIATGRGLAATRPVFEELEIETGFSVSSNGAQTVRWERTQDGRRVYQKLGEVYFDPREAAAAILDAVPGSIIAADNGNEIMRVSQSFPEGELASVQEIRSLEEILANPAIRMVARAPWLSRVEFETLLMRCDLSNVECAIGWTSWADITRAGTTKAQGLQELVTRLGVDPQGTFAIGDGSNDIAMLRWAAHGVAMGTATPDVVAAANATTGPVDYDGAAAVIEALLERY